MATNALISPQMHAIKLGGLRPTSHQYAIATRVRRVMKYGVNGMYTMQPLVHICHYYCTNLLLVP